MSEPSNVVLLRIEALLRAQLERMGALHADIAQLLAVMVQKTSNGAVGDVITSAHDRDSDR